MRKQLPTNAYLRFEDLECVYDERKLKPGIRPGAIEHLSQRLGKVFSLAYLFDGKNC